MVRQKCLYCNKEFSTYPSANRKYCSVRCSQKAQGLKGKRWTKEEEDYISANYSTHTAAEIAQNINRTKAAVDLHIFYHLNLRKKGYSQLLHCDYCGKAFKRPPSLIGHIWGNFCSRKCRGEWISEHIIKEQHPNWQGGKIPYNGLWRQIRRLARKRAKGQCEICGKTEITNGRRLDVHHIIPVRQFLFPESAHYVKNVICLCRQCHIRTHHPS